MGIGANFSKRNNRAGVQREDIVQISRSTISPFQPFSKPEEDDINILSNSWEGSKVKGGIQPR